MKKLLRVLVMLLVLTIIAVSCVVSVSAEEKTSNRFNVVFVIDASGSMLDTDPDKLRFDATNLFLGLLANYGNYVGSVIFTDTIVATNTISAVSGSADKAKIQSAMEKAPVNGGTDIGLALDKAVKMLDDNRNEKLPSAIVFLSDGNTDLDTDEDYANSKKQKASAINIAREKDYKVYSICLNVDGTADKKELSQISEATSGAFDEVKNADDLKDVFSRFYNLIYSTSTTEISGGIVPPNGKIKARFEVPNAGVEEVNIIISTKSSIKNLMVTKPSGTKLEGDEINKCTTVSRSFTITKFTSPEGGDWSLEADGKAGDEFKIEMVYNDCLSVAMGDIENTSFSKGETLDVYGYLYNNSEKVTSQDGYEDYKAVLSVSKIDSDGNPGNTEEYPMEVEGGSYKYNLLLDDYGTYRMFMTVTGNKLTKTTENSPVEVTVGNTPPEVIKSKSEHHYWLWPFVSNSAEIDISGAVKDAEDSELKYTVVSSSFLSESYNISGTTLKLNEFDLPEGSFTIKATDSMGASAEFEVAVTSTNIGIVALIIFGGIALIVLAAVGVVLYIALNKRFMGECFVSTFNYATGEYSEEVKRSKSRGRIKLSAFGLYVDGVDANKCYIQATGKDHVYLVSKKPVYGGGRLSKKVRVSDMQVEVKKDITAQCGYKIRFASRLKKNAWF